MPAAFQQHADAIYNATYHTPHKLLPHFAAMKPDAYARLRALPATAKVEPFIRDALKEVHIKVYKSNGEPNRGRRREVPVASGKPANRPPASRPVSNSKREPLLHDLSLIDSDVFWNEEHNPAETFPISELNPYSTGITLTSAVKTGTVLIEHIDKPPLQHPCALVTKQDAFDLVNQLKRSDLKTRFRAQSVTLAWADKKGNPFTIVCLVFQLGTEDIDVKKPNEADHIVADIESANYVQVSVQCPDFDNTKDFEATTRKNFAKEVTLAIGAELLHAETTPSSTRFRPDMPFCKDKINILEGKALVKRTCLQQLRKRSGLGKYYFNLWPGTGNPKDFAILRPCPQSTVAQARTASAKLGSRSQGLTLTKTGVAVKVLAEDALAAKKVLDPEYAAAVGDQLLGLAPEDGYFLQAMGVPFPFRDIDIATKLVIPPKRTSTQEDGIVDHPRWNCEPITRLEGGSYGTKNMLIRACRNPCTNLVRIQYGDKVYPVHLIEYTKPHRRMDVMEKAEHQQLQKAAKQTVAPVQPRQWGGTTTTPNWADQSEPQADEEDAMSGIHIGTPKHSNDNGDDEPALPTGFFQNDSQDAEDHNPNPAEPTPVHSKPSPWAAPTTTTTPRHTHNDDRFRKLEEQRLVMKEQMLKTDRLQREAADKAAQQDNDMSKLFTTLTSLQQDIIDQGAKFAEYVQSNEARLESFARQQKEGFDQLVALITASQQLPTPINQLQYQQQQQQQHLANAVCAPTPTPKGTKPPRTRSTSPRRQPAAASASAAAAAATNPDTRTANTSSD